MEYQFFTLSNGIKVIHQQVNSPVAHFGVILNTGSRDEKSCEQGLAHFIEHTIFKGTKKRKAFQIINRIEDVGGELNAYTTKEETAFYSTFLSEYYERAIDLISDILINASFPEKEIELEKEVIIEEINSYNDSPSELIFDEFEELIFEGHSIARNILGTPELVRSFTQNDILNFIRSNYSTSQMVICSVGKIDFARFKRLVSNYFEPMASTSYSSSRLKFDNALIARNSSVIKDTFQSHCVIGGTCYDFSSDKRLTMMLLNNILGGNSMNSRLNMALRERNGMAYNVESNYTPYTDTGVFTVYFGTERDNLERAIALVEKEFKLLREKKMGLLQLSRSKKQMIGQLAIANENNEELMLTIGRSILLFDKVDSLEEVFGKIESISSSMLLEVANEMLDNNQCSKLYFL